jgi:uncharacterized protein (TIGR02996 family)
MRSDAELALIQAILDADEDDDEARLVYADFLMERGDPRGELIAVQCREQTDILDNHARNIFDLEARWLGTLEGETTTWRFRRGFLDHLAIPIDTFVALGTAMLEVDPYPDELVHLRSLELTVPRTGTVEPLVPELCKLLGRLRLTTLKLELEMSVGVLHALRLAPLETITTLRVPRALHHHRRFPELLLACRLDRLHTLELGWLDPEQAHSLAHAPRYRDQIRGLTVAVPNDQQAIAARQLVTPNLTSLAIECFPMHHDLLDELARLRPPLVELALRRVVSDTLAPLAALPTLERLDLRDGWFYDDAFDTLLALPRLGSLNLARTQVTPAGLERLLREARPSLRELTIATPGLTHAFVEQLRKRFEVRRWS